MSADRESYLDPGDDHVAGAVESMLPPLVRGEGLLYGVATFGFVAVTLGVITGIVRATRTVSAVRSDDGAFAWTISSIHPYAFEGWALVVVSAMAGFILAAVVIAFTVVRRVIRDGV
jgi:ABC-type uncharacterized transport system permease subunit